MRYEDLTGQRFGRLTVLERAPKPSKQTYWLCSCDCGNQATVRGSNLRCGKTKSCGCLHDELSSARLKAQNTTHGESQSRLYGIWCDMKKRCNNPSHWAYARYGGRGIAVCDEWQGFESFYDWAMSHGYSDSLTIERTNNNEEYCPQNCQWVSMTVQSRNRSNNTTLEFADERLTVSEWAERMSMAYTTLYGRIYNYGWSVEKALTTPVRRHKPYGSP